MGYGILNTTGDAVEVGRLASNETFDILNSTVFALSEATNVTVDSAKRILLYIVTRAPDYSMQMFDTASALTRGTAEYTKEGLLRVLNSTVNTAIPNMASFLADQNLRSVLTASDEILNQTLISVATSWTTTKKVGDGLVELTGGVIALATRTLNEVLDKPFGLTTFLINRTMGTVENTVGSVSEAVGEGFKAIAQIGNVPVAAISAAVNKPPAPAWYNSDWFRMITTMVGGAIIYRLIR
jgi:hypothetical protein